MRSLKIARASPRSLAVFATIGALMRADVLPGSADVRSRFAPGHAHVRRVAGYNLWILYRFDATHVDVLTVRDEPPVPDGESA
jgi:hypothetical protein